MSSFHRTPNEGQDAVQYPHSSWRSSRSPQTPLNQPIQFGDPPTQWWRQHKWVDHFRSLSLSISHSIIMTIMTLGIVPLYWPGLSRCAELWSGHGNRIDRSFQRRHQGSQKLPTRPRQVAICYYGWRESTWETWSMWVEGGGIHRRNRLFVAALNRPWWSEAPSYLQETNEPRLGDRMSSWTEYARQIRGWGSHFSCCNGKEREVGCCLTESMIDYCDLYYFFVMKLKNWRFPAAW